MNTTINAVTTFVVLAIIIVAVAALIVGTVRRAKRPDISFENLSRGDQAALLESQRDQTGRIGRNESAKAQAATRHHNHGAGGR